MTKNEILVLGGILLVIGLAANFNFQKAQVLARDVQRKNDLKHIGAALAGFLKDNNFYPDDIEGKIAACGDPETPRACVWAADSIDDYISPLPSDPRANLYQYLYLSNKRNFQLYAALERTTDAEYSPVIVARGLKCGEKICNFGVGSSGDVSLDLELPELPETTP